MGWILCGDLPGWLCARSRFVAKGNSKSWLNIGELGLRLGGGPDPKLSLVG